MFKKIITILTICLAAEAIRQAWNEEEDKKENK